MSEARPARGDEFEDVPGVVVVTHFDGRRDVIPVRFSQRRTDESPPAT